ncbi:hydroxyethylthiazole kinase [Stenotrophomonas sp. MMGLT7]|uniref:hydroxyethylthiazole kinase n=1 Tax=Stenotrophomonas sp. MMGLT7 TaxID=2901227 RepID=UPI001E5D29E1|nr:hydroxyethylthiazole kinase [Stenotrophomonas sp. MMGLT7]MCD7098072.1 hydroxyethylthiazole kinase [Stenotrophomonas sp. MMGLT7]
MNAAVPFPPSPGEALRLLRARTPLVQCITNSVVTGFTANVLLALGATPAMVDIPGESSIFAAIADGVLVNLGTPTPGQSAAALEVPAATRRWVLDPVAVGVLPVRTALASQLLAARPAIVRGNASEILALAGMGEGGRGVDAIDTPEAALAAAAAIARRCGAVVAVSGPVDLITDGTEVVRVSGGDALLTRVTGGGCSLGATMAAFLGVCAALPAAIAASVVHSAAAEHAAARADGPGSFAVAFLDALAALEPAALDQPGRLARLALDAPAEMLR